ncbi:hypothetical protein [Pantoea dispersa]|uniref:hypothetical protein n=1 Tax=Pantoea dispersa TaxID=59814 RepID=UPI0039B4E995
MFKFIILSGMLIFSLTTNAMPKISVGSMYDFIEGDKSTFLKRIRNTGESTAFVRTEVSEIIYAADGSRKEVKLNAKNASSKDIDGLIFTPSRMIIPSKGMQSGRMVITGSREKERYYRIRYIPVMPKDRYEFGQTENEFKQYGKQLKAGINVLTGYGAMVIVRPKNTIFKTTIEEKGNDIIIHNYGNSSIIIDDIKSCKEKICSETHSVIVMPGSNKVLNRDLGRSLNFNLLEGSKKTSKIFK